jgi:hypothetical protein
MYISNLTKRGEYAYRATETEGNIEVEVALRQSTFFYREGGYEMERAAWNKMRRPLGSKQRARAAVLKCEVQRAFVEALEAAGWRCEQKRYAGFDLYVWFAPQEA